MRPIGKRNAKSIKTKLRLTIEKKQTQKKRRRKHVFALRRIRPLKTGPRALWHMVGLLKRHDFAHSCSEKKAQQSGKGSNQFHTGQNQQTPQHKQNKQPPPYGRRPKADITANSGRKFYSKLFNVHLKNDSKIYRPVNNIFLIYNQNK